MQVTEIKSRTLASIPDGVTGIFHWRNPSGRTMSLGFTQPVIEIGNRNISWGKAGRSVIVLHTLVSAHNT
jgi:hypothetical protein